MLSCLNDILFCEVYAKADVNDCNHTYRLCYCIGCKQAQCAMQCKIGGYCHECNNHYFPVFPLYNMHATRKSPHEIVQYEGYKKKWSCVQMVACAGGATIVKNSSTAIDRLLKYA